MKIFLLTSAGFLLLAIVLTVIVFFFVSEQIDSPDTRPATESAPPQLEQDIAPDSIEEAPAEEQGEATDIAATDISDEQAGPEGIRVSDLSLSAEQRATLETLGIDIETFIITTTMIDCAEERLSAERVSEIVSGAAPTFFETARLSTCLAAN